jgi:hypothetical protein
MAHSLRSNTSGREYDKFTLSETEGTAVRVAAIPGGSVESNVTTTVSGRTTVTTTETVLIQKQSLNGKTGSWFVYNSGAKAIDVKMYSAYASGASDYAQPASTAIEWDQVGSTQTIAAGTTKHIPFNNVYRFVALAASTSTSQSLGVEAELYAIPN